MRIIVTGGFGDLGSRVAREASLRGHDAMPVSRRTGLDLTTGAGLVAVLRGADVVVNCADDPRRGAAVMVDGSRRLAEAANAAEAPVHLVHISIVGIDDFPMSYYRRKLAAERALAASGAAVTVLRATQFHSLAAFFARTLTRGGLTFQVGRMAFQPVDTDWVAAQLLDVAEAPRPTGYERADDIAGPEVLTVAQLAAAVRRHGGQRPGRVLPLAAPFGALRAFGKRQNIPAAGQARTGGRTFADWLAQQPRELEGR
ncbi:MAG: sugar nucleotide-binding protein [Humibacillus sp.]|nr:sugar nucleotide-binding protein [Humibacillus sp.]MDN5777071.1 sugar nucleotide-binding protein [Humibacillus sp.]